MIKRFILLFLVLISAITQKRVEAKAFSSIDCPNYAVTFQGEPTNIVKIDLNTGLTEIIKENVTGGELITNLGYNKLDGSFWGYNMTKKADGIITKIGKTPNGEWISENFKVDGITEFPIASGDVDKNGHLYLKGARYPNCTKVAVVDVNPKSSTYLKKIKDLNLDCCYNASDWAFNPIDGMLYSVIESGLKRDLIKIDPITGRTLSREDTSIGGGRTFSNQYFDKYGYLYVNDTKTGEIYRIDPTVSPPKVVPFSQSEPVNVPNNGAACSEGLEYTSDFGDLPDSYHTLLESAGPRHIIPPKYIDGYYNPPTLFLGYSITGENDGILSDKANADDGDDGVTIRGESLQDNSINKETLLDIKTTGYGYLNAWIDWNGNDVFDNDEQIAKNITPYTMGGDIRIKINMPDSAKEGKTFARFRYSSQSNLSPIGTARDGEVEDYSIKVQKEIKKGVFNIERTSSGSYEINSKERNAWYTQIVGRDFHYSLLFYDELMEEQRELKDITVKIELVDQDSKKVLFTKYDYIPEPSACWSVVTSKNWGRKDYLDLNDLNSLPATRDAIFSVSYGVDDNGNIIQEPCDKLDPKECFDSFQKTDTVYSRDNFAIRPEYFHVIISDNDKTLMVNRSPYNKGSIRLTAGYDYNLTMTASAFGKLDDKPSPNYNTTVNKTLEFLDKNNKYVVDSSDIKSKDIFKEGKSVGGKLEIQEVGRYRLHIIDSEWTTVDIKEGDCIKDSATVSESTTTKSGCNIISIPDINVTFYPDHFNVNLELQNLPPSSHDDFLYMSEINSTYSDVAISYNGKITAKSEDNITTKNFIKDYMAENTTIDLSGTTKSQEGIDGKIKTVKGSPIYFTRVLRFNSDTEVQVDRKQIFNELPTINVPKAKFLNEQNGSVNIDLRYNVGKHLSEPINPIQIEFKSIDVNSSDAYSLSHGKDESNPHTPIGKEELGGVRNLYTSQVVPDKIVCPTIKFSEEDIVRTPLQVEIYCGGGVNYQYCEDTNLTKHIRLDSSPRAEVGWFLSYDHNSSVDGVIEELKQNPEPPKVLEFRTISPQTFPIRCENGRNGTVTTKFIDLTVDTEYRVDIYPSTPLKFYSGKPKPNIPLGIPHYIVQGVPKPTPDPDGDWIGKGKTGNVLDIDSRGSVNYKMDW